MQVLRKLRLLFEQFPKMHNLILFGQPDLFHYLSMNVNQDIKSRITYSATIKPLNNDDMELFDVFGPSDESGSLLPEYRGRYGNQTLNGRITAL
jgi:hypothetical protein